MVIFYRIFFFEIELFSEDITSEEVLDETEIDSDRFSDSIELVMSDSVRDTVSLLVTDYEFDYLV